MNSRNKAVPKHDNFGHIFKYAANDYEQFYSELVFSTNNMILLRFSLRITF